MGGLLGTRLGNCYAIRARRPGGHSFTVLNNFVYLGFDILPESKCELRTFEKRMKEAVR